MMKDFRGLKVWEKSHQLTLEIYRATATFPREEIYGLTSQMRRASASVAANLSEGCGRASDKEFARFLYISMGSANELDYHLLLAHDLNLLATAKYLKLKDNIAEIKRMLNALIQKLTTNR